MSFVQTLSSKDVGIIQPQMAVDLPEFCADISKKLIEQPVVEYKGRQVKILPLRGDEASIVEIFIKNASKILGESRWHVEELDPSLDSPFGEYQYGIQCSPEAVSVTEQVCQEVLDRLKGGWRVARGEELLSAPRMPPSGQVLPGSYELASPVTFLRDAVLDDEDTLIRSELLLWDVSERFAYCPCHVPGENKTYVRVERSVLGVIRPLLGVDLQVD